MQKEAMMTSAVLHTVIPFFLKLRKLSALFKAISVPSMSKMVTSSNNDLAAL